MAKGERQASRKQRRDERKREREAAELANREADQRRRRILWITGVSTAALTLALYFADAPRALIGMTLLAGCGVLLTVGLGALGSGVKARDRSKAGNIDYGN
ncbi:MAG: hypothetical protein OEZ06_21240 [Myxococcales bacterium]|nr:hypothetical protein [Myxococcales bacterium]